jgi:hypothetical protein
MNRLMTIIALGGVIVVCSRAIGAESTGQPKMSQHRMTVKVAACMRKRMFADKSSSYNEAKEACKDQINNESGNLSSDALVAFAAPAKR